MNWDQVEGNWEKVKGKIRESWGRLTDNDMNIIKGQRQVLSGKIQERYGHTKEVVEQEIDKFLKTAENDKSDCSCTRTILRASG